MRPCPRANSDDRTGLAQMNSSVPVSCSSRTRAEIVDVADRITTEIAIPASANAKYDGASPRSADGAMPTIFEK